MDQTVSLPSQAIVLSGGVNNVTFAATGINGSVEGDGVNTIVVDAASGVTSVYGSAASDDTITVTTGAGLVYTGAIGSTATIYPTSGNVSVYGGAGGTARVIAGQVSIPDGKGGTVFVDGQAFTGSLTVVSGTGTFQGGSAGGNMLTASAAGGTTLIGGGNGDVLKAGGAGDVLVAAATGTSTLDGSNASGGVTFWASATGTTLMYGSKNQGDTFYLSNSSTAGAGFKSAFLSLHSKPGGALYDLNRTIGNVIDVSVLGSQGPAGQASPQYATVADFITGVDVLNIGTAQGNLTFSSIAAGTSYAGTVITTAAGSSITLYNNTSITSANVQRLDLGSVPLCYLRGTRVLTPTGEVAVEDLRIGDRLVCRFGGIRPIRWIGRQAFGKVFVAHDRDRIPVRIKAGALEPGVPARDLHVSPGHSMLVDGTLLLARALVNGVTILQDDCPDELHYYQVEFDTHDCVIAEGTWSESYADQEGLRGQFHNATEFDALYPDHCPPEELSLCAPRPMDGAKLGAALRPVVARAAAGIAPGPLRGSIDMIDLPWRIEGWAQDSAHRELPVSLEVVLAGRVIGTMLACDYRHDLMEAGIGSGRHSFAYRSSIRIPMEAWHDIRIRRAGDGAELQMSDECRTRLQDRRDGGRVFGTRPGQSVAGMTGRPSAKVALG